MALVGLESTSYNVSEDKRVVEICVIVYGPYPFCLINFAFNVTLVKIVDSSLDDGSAGNIKQSSHTHKNYIFPLRSQTVPRIIMLWVNAYFSRVSQGVV